jgi:hypothetical protein
MLILWGNLAVDGQEEIAALQLMQSRLLVHPFV